MSVPITGSPVVLGIAGCSGSGKSSLAHELARQLGGTHFALDNYYRNFPELTYEERCQLNFDDPSTLEEDLLAKDVRALAQGRRIERPIYDFTTHSRVAGVTERMHVEHLLIVDGLFALYYGELRPLYHLSIYVDTPDTICYERRLKRDICERGRTAECVADHYAATVRPMAEKYVRPAATFADLVVAGTASLDWSVEQVLNQLRERSLLQLLEQRSHAGLQS